MKKTLTHLQATIYALSFTYAKNLLLNSHPVPMTGQSYIRSVSEKKVLLLECFDGTITGSRKQMLSALTILGKSEFESGYSSYSEIADAIRLGPWAQVSKTLWDGSVLRLTSALDLTPQSRSWERATHAIGITGDEIS